MMDVDDDFFDAEAAQHQMFVIGADERMVFAHNSEDIGTPLADIARRLKRPDLLELGRAMLRNAPGDARTQGWDSGETQWVFYAMVHSPGWVLGLRVDESTVRRWRAKHEGFRVRCDAVVAERYRQNADDLKLRAGEERTRPVFFRGKQIGEQVMHDERALMFLLKLIGSKMGWWKKLGRWRYVIVPLMSLAAAVLAKLQGGLSFQAAAAVFSSAYATASLEELWTHGILGKPRSGAGE